MTARILDGKAAAAAYLADVRPRIAELDPLLVIVQVGDNEDSERYIRAKMKKCKEIGMRTGHRHLPANITVKALIAEIEKLNDDPSVTGFIVQLPLPDHLGEHQPLIIRAMNPKKDVDGLTAYNLGKLFVHRDFEHLPPATPAGVIRLLEHENISVAGKHAVIIGRSTLVGKPLGIMLLHRDATVTFCHSRTPDLSVHTKTADILVAAAGEPGLITKDMVKPGAVVIDIGFTGTEEGVLGDVAADVAQVAGALTPVPGGVGPMTVASLIMNVVTAAKRQQE